MALPVNQISRDAQQALTEFSSDLDQALATAAPESQWATDAGLTNNSQAIVTTYPLPLDAAGYRRRKGDDILRRLYERSVSMTPEEWQDGIEELAWKIEAPDFSGWGQAPARIALESQRHPNAITAAMLKLNPLLGLYEEKLPGGNIPSTIRLFADNHPVNILDSSLGTFDNDQSAVTIDATMLSACKLRFRQRKATNGKPMGSKLTHLYVPAALEELAKDFFESDTLVLAVENAGGTIVSGIPRNNRHKGSVQLVVCPELLDDNVVYALDLSLGCYPWIIQTPSAPEEIRYDKDSTRYKDTGMVGLKYVMRSAVAAALPHAIERITLTG